jgi:hypothetical protein
VKGRNCSVVTDGGTVIPRKHNRDSVNTIIMGLERGPLSLVSTTEELLDRKVAAPV